MLDGLCDVKSDATCKKKSLDECGLRIFKVLAAERSPVVHVATYTCLRFDVSLDIFVL